MPDETTETRLAAIEETLSRLVALVEGVLDAVERSPFSRYMGLRKK